MLRLLDLMERDVDVKCNLFYALEKIENMSVEDKKRFETLRIQRSKLIKRLIKLGNEGMKLEGELREVEIELYELFKDPYIDE